MSDLERAEGDLDKALADLDRTIGRMVPPGYEVVQTDERVSLMATKMTRWGAERFAHKYPPFIPSYTLRIERRGFMAWEVVAYQNVLQPIQ